MPALLYDYQIDAIKKMHNGSILCGKVGSGKSRTSLAYYFMNECGGSVIDEYIPMCQTVNLYIITTARKRDTKEWEGELTPFLISVDHPEDTIYPELKVYIDSWNNIGKYVGVKDAFFIFDEQRVVGKGAWVKAFLKITKVNHWILLSATPGDTWMDYVPVFIANGYFKNRTEFNERHVVFNHFTKFPQVDRYVNQGKLIRYRNELLVNMDYTKPTRAHNETIDVDYDRLIYKDIMATRWNIYENKPIENPAELCFVLRKTVNSDVSRIQAVLDLMKDHPKVIVFYNYDYELDILKNAPYDMDISIAEWNGHKHQLIPKTDKWIYLVQYNAGAEGWNCIETDTMIFFSLSYSYKVMVQSAGRIDRMNTPFTDLYYYRLRSNSPIDIAISRTLKKKQNFNENKFCTF
jgi:hypothetical protein